MTMTSYTMIRVKNETIWHKLRVFLSNRLSNKPRELGTGDLPPTEKMANDIGLSQFDRDLRRHQFPSQTQRHPML
ncbi:hypothetical protein [Phaeobacter sp. NW0010-22]|uniref:hypothetical protein n=1 Tax=Phaeobacter sp. NW0010-22 TaxID=3135907 RepID=UPI0013C50B15